MLKHKLLDLLFPGKYFPVSYFILLILLIAPGIPAAFAQTANRDASDSSLAVMQQASFSPVQPPGPNTVYPVLYGRQTTDELTGSFGFLQGKTMRSSPTAFISNAFAGRIAGIYTLQQSGEPGNDGSAVTLRGREPIVLVDGIPRTIYSVNPEQIESITVLKDGLSAAMLGIRGMNGAVLITTRKGEKVAGLEMDFTAQAGISTPVKLPQPLSAYQYATLYNEALANDGKTPLYAQADLDAYKNGTDPYGHPDVNWYDKLLKKQALFSRYTLNASGTNRKNMHYFVSLDYLDQDGLFRESSVNTYGTNSRYQRYIVRSNVSVDLTPRISMYLNLFGSIQDQDNPGGGAANIFNTLLNTPNNAYPVLNPDSSLGGSVNFSNNLYGQSVLSGYTKTIYSNSYADLGLQRNMDDILKGWWVKAAISYGVSLNQLIDRTKAFETFKMLVNPGTGDTTYQQYGTKSDQHNASYVIGRDNQLYVEGSTGYTHHWGRNSLDVLLIYNLDNYTDSSNLPNIYQTLGARAQYSMQDKYVLEVAASYSGNNRYEPGHRFGFFPAAGVAWNIHHEDFFRKDGLISTLKLRASYGLNGNAVAGYYDYIDRYAGATGYFFGTSAASAAGRAFKQPRDVNTWEKALKLDIGLDMGFAKNRGMLTVDYYHNNLADLVQASGRSSALLGWGDNIVQNLGKDLYSGLEVTAGWADKAGSFSYYISGNFSVSSSKVQFNDGPDYPYSWMQKTGHKVGQIFGYVADGFVTQAGEGPVAEGYNSVPGDIKYKDLNDDGVINQFDMQAIGTKKPLMFYGADIGLSWKNISLTFLIQGVADRDILMTGPDEWEFQSDGKGQAWAHNLDRWTPATAANAAYPRLSVGTNVNNDIVSSFWVHPGSYLRLKNAELGYSFNKIDLGKVKLKQLRLFVNGFNLITISRFKQTDPETMAGYYPLQRVVNGGVTIRF